MSLQVSPTSGGHIQLLFNIGPSSGESSDISTKWNDFYASLSIETYDYYIVSAVSTVNDSYNSPNYAIGSTIVMPDQFVMLNDHSSDPVTKYFVIPLAPNIDPTSTTLKNSSISCKNIAGTLYANMSYCSYLWVYGVKL